jgi:hypothetical protein
MHRFILLTLLFAQPVGAELQETFPLRENGTIPAWLIAGPLPYHPTTIPDGKRGGIQTDYLETYGGETQTVPCEGDRIELETGRAVQWQTTVSDTNGVIDFLENFNADMTREGVAYAFCELESEKSKDVLLKIRSNDGVRVWCNDRLVHENLVSRTLEQGEDHVRVSLKAGANRLLCKVDQEGGGWGLCVTLHESNGDFAKEITSRIHQIEPLKGKIKSASFLTSPLIINTEAGERQSMIANVVSGGVENVICKITCEAWSAAQEFHLGDAPMGKHTFEFAVPPISGPIRVALESSSDQKEFNHISIPPARKWTVYLVQHVHTDIGYTRPQTEILPEHLRYIDYALDFCDLTDSYPDDAKFRWTCEVSWAVREYLKRRPADQIARLKRRVEEGRIELAGMFLNMAEIATESSLAASLQPIRTFKEEFALPVRSALQNDVNGAAWCLVDYFSDIGVNYLSMGINKTRSLLPFDKPTAFWWESPSGKRIIAFRPDHYHTGNFWRIHEGKIEPFKTGLMNYLRGLEEREYPFDRISVQFSGYHTDNSPPAMIECDLVREWNETYAWPKLRIATAREFMDYVAEHHADELDVRREAWPDWWTDGFGSAARETAASRDMHVAMQINQTLLAMAAALGAQLPSDVMQRVDEAQELLLFYDEHTYGAAESISDPMAENSMVQWGEKSSYVWEAVKKAGMLREEAFGMIQGFLPKADTPTITTLNTLNWERSGLIELFIDDEILPRDRDFRIVDAKSGESIPAQYLRGRSEGSYWAIWAKNVPPIGYKTYRIEVQDGQRESSNQSNAANGMENDFYSLTFQPETGAVISLFDKTDNRQLVESQSEWGLGQFLYETLSDGREFQRHKFKRTTLRNVKIKDGPGGPIWKSKIITGDADGCFNPGGLHCEIRLFETEKRIDFLYGIRKQPVTDAEAVYIAFPFHQPGAKLVYEAQGGMVTPGENQIPRSSSDWQTIQNFAAVRSPDGQTIFVSDQTPLAQFGDINLGKWQESAQIEHPFIFSWVMNNYWFTNFRASQEGEFKWRYSITSTQDTSNGAATQFGWGTRIPLVSRVFPPAVAQKEQHPLSLSILNPDAPNLLLIEARPARYGEGIILQLREVEGKQATLNVRELSRNDKTQPVDEVNVLEEPLKENLASMVFSPYEVKFLHVGIDLN